MKIVLYYYGAAGGNFGDMLAPLIVRTLARRPISTINGYRPSPITAWKNRCCRSRLLALGSIMHHARDGDVIWGAGINPHYQSKWEARRDRPPRLDIRAIRGPLSRRHLREKLRLDCPELYGDPAQLLKELFPEFTARPVRRYGIVPHYRDLPLFAGEPNAISPLSPWRAAIDFILGCELVVASSLHALIVAEAFGIPARWLHSSALPSAATEGAFKFNDYYLATGRDGDDYVESVEEALRRGGKELGMFDTARFRNSFPDRGGAALRRAGAA